MKAAWDDAGGHRRSRHVGLPKIGEVVSPCETMMSAVCAIDSGWSR